MCVANSARSQLAEALARKILGPEVEIASAGSKPTTVNPWAIKVLAEIGLDVSVNRSKTVADLPDSFVASLDYIITLCAEEVCPVVQTKAKRLHWPLPDPAKSTGADHEHLDRFRMTRDRITRLLEEFAESLGR